MPELGGTFDTSTAEKRQTYEVIKGWHPAEIIESDVRPTKKDAHLPPAQVRNRVAFFTFRIIDGPHKDRRVWSRPINIQNESLEAQRIGQSELRELCEALGFGQVDNTDVLHLKPLELKCGPDKDDPEKTVPKGYRAYGAAGQARPAASPPQGGFQSRPEPSQTQQQPQQRAAAGGGSRPWR